MFANERYAAILRRLQAQGSVTVAELMEAFGVSIETVRRDLAHLEAQNALARVHGGAVQVEQLRPMAALAQRRLECPAQKRAVANAAAALLHEDDWIFLDSGSTALLTAQALRARFRHLSVITNSLEVFSCLAEGGDFSLYLAGGEYMPAEQAFFGAQTLSFVRSFHTVHALICPSSISLRNGVCDFIAPLMDVQRAMMECTDETVFLADSAKFQAAAPLRLCPLSPAQRIVTDASLPPELAAAFRDASLRIDCTAVPEAAPHRP